MNISIPIFTTLGFLVIAILVIIPLFKNLKFGLDLQGGFEVLYEVKGIDSETVTSDMVTNTYKTIMKRIDVLGVSEPVITVEGENHIRVQIPGVTDKDTARNLLAKTANLTFRDTSDNLLMTSTVLKSGGARLSSDSTGKPAVSLSVADKETFYKITKQVSQMSDNRIVIWLDYEQGDTFTNEQARCGNGNSNCLSAATVSQGFATDVIIQGNFSRKQAENLVELINSGSLPTKLEEISSKTVAASFGEDSLQKTFVAGIIGIAIIILFMIVVYRLSGFVASIGIIVYTALTFFIFWLVGGVLTLPGIAAVVIGIGMAVDSNVISFSRMKDELYNGCSVSRAFALGNKNSFMTILDSNITTLLVAIILFIFGESSIKGFATMLIISIFVTMIVMVGFTRWLLRQFVETGKLENNPQLFIGVSKKRIPNKEKKEVRTYFEHPKLQFVSKRKWFYIGSSLILIAGIVCLSTMGLNLGIDFKGGTSVTLKTNQAITKKQLETDFQELDYKVTEIELLNDKQAIITLDETLEKDSITTCEKFFQEKYQAQTDIGVVSNVVKRELLKNAIISLSFAALGMILYISARFTFAYAISAIIALLHDVFFVIALFSIFRFEVSTIFIAAILSIIGYSINDTIVSFDRIKENIKLKYKDKLKNKEELEDVVNTSLRQTFNRSIITTVTTLIPVVCLIIFGSHEITTFNYALLFGLIAGAYSSIFIASQLWFDFTKKNVGKPIKKKWYEIEESGPQEKKMKGINS